MPVDKYAEDYKEHTIDQNCCPKCKSTNIVKGLSKWICKSCFEYFKDPVIMPITYGFNMSAITPSLIPFKDPYEDLKQIRAEVYRAVIPCDFRIRG